MPGEDELKVAEGYKLQPITLLLILGAFSNGCAALTGIEAISNGVPAFKQPEARNASTTLVVMAVLLTTMFLGTSVMAYLYGVHPHENETVISQFGRIMFTGAFGWFYYVVQIANGADSGPRRQHFLRRFPPARFTTSARSVSSSPVRQPRR